MISTDNMLSGNMLSADNMLSDNVFNTAAFLVISEQCGPGTMVECVEYL
jgi:hypothetical protein